jgi:DNA-binding transcriptional LysR family regulator
MQEDYALFAAVVDAGSLSAAARTLKTSTAKVSKRLAALERRLGAQLIQRTTRRLSLTGVGRAFHEQVVEILAKIEQAEAIVAGDDVKPSGRLRISAPTSFGRMHIAPRLKDFLTEHPSIKVEIDLTDDFADLRAERIDVAVRIGPPPDSSLDAQRLAPNRRLLCAAPGYIEAHGEPRKTSDLADHRLLAANGQLPWRLKGPDDPRIIQGKSLVSTNSSEVVRELVLAGAGIALRSTWDVADHLHTGELIRLLPDYEGTDVSIYAVWQHADWVSPNVRAFTAFLLGLYAPVPPWDREAGIDEDGA